MITDLFFQGDLEFSNEEINQLKVKANGGKRLVVAYFSIGEAEDYRYYWKESWNNNLPDFIEAENPDWEGNFKVNYWDAGWQEILYGNENMVKICYYKGKKSWRSRPELALGYRCRSSWCTNKPS